MSKKSIVTAAAPDRAYAPINGLRMYYEVQGRGTPLVLLHGGLLTIDLTFGSMLASLAERYTVIAPELQGHGHTGDVDREMTLEQLADDVAALLAHVGVAQADVFGFSLGGLVALATAVRHPSRVNRLVLASIASRRDGYRDGAGPGRADPAPESPPPFLQILQDAYRRVAPNPEHFPVFAAKAQRMVANMEGWCAEELRQVTAPTLVVLGDNDCVRLEHAVEMVALIPNAQLAVLPGTDHAGVMRSSQPTLSLVERFLAVTASNDDSDDGCRSKLAARPADEHTSPEAVSDDDPRAVVSNPVGHVPHAARRVGKDHG